MILPTLKSLCKSLDDIVCTTTEFEISTIGVNKLDAIVQLSSGEYLKNTKGMLDF